MKIKIRSLLLVVVFLGVSLLAWTQSGKFVSRPTEMEYRISGINNVNYVDVDTDGMIYVSAQVEGAVQIYRPDGTLEMKFGHRMRKGISVEDDPMGLDMISGISLDKDRNIYVAQAMQGTVRVFNSFGESLMTITMPEYLAKIWDDNNVRVYKVGDPIENRKRPGKKEMGHGSPIDAAVSENGNIYVTDVGGQRICVFDYEGNFLTAFEFYQYKGFPKQYKNPAMIEINSKGEIFITEPTQNRILTIDAKGNYLRHFGKTGNTVGAFQGLSGMDIDDLDRVYCADFVIGAVQVFDDQGNFLHALTGPGGGQWKTGSIRGIAVDQRRIYLCEQTISSLQVRKFVK